MSIPELAFFAVVLLVGLPAAFFSRTALALSASWGIQEAVYLATGHGIETLTAFALDYSVLLVIFTCPSGRGRHDWAVAAVFPVMWAVHWLVADAWQRYWALWWLALAQLLVAGAGALSRYRRGRPVDADGLTHPRVEHFFAVLRRRRAVAA